ncbi:MAG: SGNH/GDSL hydrolase family protein [Clostridiales bacterium]|nr:SGNH/GDSL hydrolase family protein [Clostridiales bacterium]
MRKIFLIGDSIRYGTSGNEGYKNGYGYYVKQKLVDKAIVYQPDENCRFLQYTLRYLHEWARKLGIGENIDVVHWNNGLWDVLRLFDDEPLTSLEMYKIMLERVYKRIKNLFPNAKIIFALTTPVIEEMMDVDFYRKNIEIEQYNQAAIEVLQPLGVIINDLYRVGMEIKNNYSLDAVHFNEIGSEILAENVSNIVMEI